MTAQFMGAQAMLTNARQFGSDASADLFLGGKIADRQFIRLDLEKDHV